MKLDKIEAIIAIISFIVTLIYSMIKFLVNQLNKKLDSLKDEILLATKDSMNRFMKKNEESRTIFYEKINSNLNKINNEINLIKNNYDHQNILIDTKMAAMNQIFLEQIANVKTQLNELETEHEELKEKINISDEYSHHSNDNFHQKLDNLQKSVDSLSPHDK
ncbi:hypothetical protein [Cyanobacterium aponinum]|uniref:Uncharacterized protein n=1 Tax=Cyanobacterium aponinum (strain PCC 10605) TaxID=755178 RepID=K9ZB12_CYAAP|nr:hypothetical protein [Cyanobacterium aponinum]AFZ55568.1 hypothetical protein Cyan10605_3535 [Cyanobacterium aponinum PCC 10605]